MRWQRLLFLVFAYVLVDLADPFPGAFEFSAKESVEAIHAARHRAPTRQDAERATPGVPSRQSGEPVRVPHASLRARRPLTEWLAGSRPAHAQSADPIVAAPSEGH